MKFLPVVLFILSSLNQILCTTDDTKSEQNETATLFYTAAVVELNAPGDKFTDSDDIVDANLAEYLALIQEASEQGVDILVFPEATLNYNGINIYENLTEVAVELQVEVPSALECDYSHDVILNELSLAAANASIYVLVNVVEREPCETEDGCPSGFKLFNSNFVFDRDGCIVSHYRKFNLFTEPLMNVTEKPTLATFESDFGVTFGHFICFDILFKSPALDLINKLNVTHILYPSMWYSEIPFLTSVQIQQSFAERYNIVLLSSGSNMPENSNTGSGIFIGQHGAVDKIISYKSESRMLIAEIPKDVNDEDYEPGIPSTEPYSQEEMNEMKLWKFVSKKTYPLTHHEKLKLDNAECEFHLNYTVQEDSGEDQLFGYRLAAYSGTRSYEGIVNAGEIHCAIVSCADPNDEETCGQKVTAERSMPSVKFHKIIIKLSINDHDEENYLIMPTSLDTSILPLSTHLYQFRHTQVSGVQKYSMKSVHVNESMMTFGIYGRNFRLDNKNFNSEDKELESSDEMLTSDDSEIHDTTAKDDETDGNDLQVKMMIYIVIMVVLSIITSIMVYRKLQTPYIKPDVNRRKPSMREL